MANDVNEPNSDQLEHIETYAGFMSATKWGVIAVSVALILMAIFLA